jgi:hypothetical protein
MKLCRTEMRVTLALALALLLTAFAPLGASGQDLEVWVDPRTGSDEGGRGSQVSPYRTIGYAMRASASALAPAQTLEVHLLPGLYLAGERLQSLPEILPIELPRGVERLSIVGPKDGDAVIETAVVDATLMQLGKTLAFASMDSDIRELGEGGPADEVRIVREVQIERVTFRGGRDAVSVIGSDHEDSGAESSLSVLVVDCVFQEQRGTGVDIVAGSLAPCNVTVTDSRFVGATLGVAVAVRPGGSAICDVARCTFADFRPMDPVVLQASAAVDLHIDRGASLVARVGRNTIQDTTCGLLLTSSADAGASGDEIPAAGRMNVIVESNLIASTRAMTCVVEAPPPNVEPPRGRCALIHGLVLSLWPHHSLDIKVLNNTFWGLEGFAFYYENYTDLRALVGVDEPAPPLVVASNIVWGESGAVAGLLSNWAGDMAPPGMDLSSNVLPIGWPLGEPGTENWSEDPLLADGVHGDFHLQAGSRAVDASDLRFIDLLLNTDLGGDCRNASPIWPGPGRPYVPDRGAFEVQGFCRDHPVPTFIRGDCDAGGAIEMADAIHVFGFLFLGGRVPNCRDACDANDDGSLDLTDGVYMLGYLFLGRSEPPSPFPQPGPDPTPDGLDPCPRSSP